MAQRYETPQNLDNPLETVFSMSGGEGNSSYARNSQRQGYRWGLVKPLLEEAIQRMCIVLEKGVLRVADLGCSSGQNTVNTMDFIMEKINRFYASKGDCSPEVEAFFNDLYSTDFNTLFRLLYPSTPQCPDENRSPQGRPTYFFAGVPGSFYKRLFPKTSVHFVHSAYSIQWISKVPADALDIGSPSYNKGKVFIHKGPAAPAKAFARQFEEDFLSFLRARAEEMESGGQMFLTTGGREDTDPEARQDALSVFFGEHYEKSWQDLITEGLLSEEKRDSFNVPTYMPNVAECRSVVGKLGSAYRIEKLQLINVHTYSEEEMREYEKDAGKFADMLTGITRSVSSGLSESHIGAELSNILFDRYHKHVQEDAAYLNPLFYNMKALVVNLVRT